MDDLKIGDVASRSGLSLRTLRYYEELGLLRPPRDAGGHRRYDAACLDLLYRIRLLRELGTPVADVDPDVADLGVLTRRHLADLDARLAEMARHRERVRAVEDRLLAGERPSDTALLDLLAGLADDEPVPTRRITLLVYRDLAAAHTFLVDVLGLAPGPLSFDGDTAVHGVVHVGDGVIWLHREAPEHGMLSPLTVGAVTASLAIDVDDVDAVHARLVEVGVKIDQVPVDQPYGVRECSVRDLEGHLWSFHQPMPETSEDDK